MDILRKLFGRKLSAAAPSRSEPSTASHGQKEPVPVYQMSGPISFSGKKHDGKQVVLIDLDRLKAVIFFVTNLEQFIEKFGDPPIPFMDYIKMEYEPLIFERIDSRVKANTLSIDTLIREQGTEEDWIPLDAVKSYCDSKGISHYHLFCQWSCVTTKVGLVNLALAFVMEALKSPLEGEPMQIVYQQCGKMKKSLLVPM